MYIPVSPSQWLEVLVVLSTAEFIRYTIAKMKGVAVASESKGGHIRKESMPSTVLGQIISPIHGLATFIPPLIYIGALVFNGFRQPEWIATFTLSTEMVDPTRRNALRIGACVTSFALKGFMNSIFEHLGEQWHAIGVGVTLTAISLVLIFCNSVARGPGLSRPVRMHGFVTQGTRELLSNAEPTSSDTKGTR